MNRSTFIVVRSFAHPAESHPMLMSLAARLAGCVVARTRRHTAQLILASLLLTVASALSAQEKRPLADSGSTAAQHTQSLASNPAWKCQIEPGLAETYGAASRACDAQFRAASIRAALIDGQSVGASKDCAIRVADQVERATAAWAAADTVAALRTERVECEGRVLTWDSLAYDTRAVLRVCPGKIWSWVDRGGAGQSCAKLRDFVVAARTHGTTSHGATTEKAARRGADLTREARDWYTRGEFSRARDAARRAIATDSANALAHAMLGASLSMLGAHDDAARELRSAVAIDAGDSWAWGMLAQTLYFARRDSAVMAVARDALAVDGGNAEVLGFLGMAEIRSGDVNEAIATLTRATSLAPKDARFRASLAQALLAGGKNAEAEAAAREAIRLQPEYYGGYAELGRALEATGRKTEALAAYREAHKLAEWETEIIARIEVLQRPDTR